ncbi:uncharacterized protein Bfra_002245 [Botrytis fragariae]|uniref:Uncharacterized protein n=1 Tax=Botrytis fragariae TaxID=1964551 RepID=A0A8H6EKS2_9HELO|nr:uncharacterized protein Bfra_002245 [Botrytis fragariae]KAF5875849.1 hypothetical protein Bfra_002245 [Botrytis fragariae]
MADLEYISVLEDIKQFVLNDKLSYRGICTEEEFDATVERCHAKQVEWKTAARDMQQCIEWDVWVFYFLDYNNAEAVVNFPGRFQIAGDGPRARKFELVERRIMLSNFEVLNIWKAKIEKLETEEKRLRDEGKFEWEKLMTAALQKKKRGYLDFENKQRKRFADQIHQFYKVKADGVREEINALEVELERMGEYVKQRLEAIHQDFYGLPVDKDDKVTGVLLRVILYNFALTASPYKQIYYFEISLSIHEHTLDLFTIGEIRIKHQAIRMKEELSVLEDLRLYAANIGASYRGSCSDRNSEQMVESKKRSETRKVKDQISTDLTKQRHYLLQNVPFLQILSQSCYKSKKDQKVQKGVSETDPYWLKLQQLYGTGTY